MVSEALFNLVVLALIVSVAIHVGNWSIWYDDEEVKEQIAENKHRGNHFKDID